MLFRCISINMEGFFFPEPHDENDYNFCRAECNQTDRTSVKFDVHDDGGYERQNMDEWKFQMIRTTVLGYWQFILWVL